MGIMGCTYVIPISYSDRNITMISQTLTYLPDPLYKSTSKQSGRPKPGEIIKAVDDFLSLTSRMIREYHCKEFYSFDQQLSRLKKEFEGDGSIFCKLYDKDEPCAIGNDTDCPLSISYDPRPDGGPMGCGHNAFNFLSSTNIYTLTELRTHLLAFLKKEKEYCTDGTKSKKKSPVKLRPALWVGDVKKTWQDIAWKEREPKRYKGELTIGQKYMIIKDEPPLIGINMEVVDLVIDIWRKSTAKNRDIIDLINSKVRGITGVNITTQTTITILKRAREV